jgi:uncharacterized membrane protein YsdA (DUF1294 family)
MMHVPRLRPLKIIPSSLNQRESPRRTTKVKVSAGTVLASLIVVIGLLILPVMALHRVPWDFRWIGLYALVINAMTFGANAWDKRRAETGGWRVPEAQLHLMELIGGWPGAWMAQRCLRHKTSKASYRFVFWLIVFAHQFVAFDFLRDGQVSRAGLKWVQQFSERRK